MLPKSLPQAKTPLFSSLQFLIMFNSRRLHFSWDHPVYSVSRLRTKCLLTSKIDDTLMGSGHVFSQKHGNKRSNLA